jgi:hypothetical protein
LAGGCGREKGIPCERKREKEERYVNGKLNYAKICKRGQK